MKRNILTFSLVLSIAIGMIGCSSKRNSDNIALKTKIDTVSYILGIDQGQRLKTQKLEINPDAFFKGLDYGIKGKDILSDTVKQNFVAAFQSELQVKQREETAKIAIENKKKGAEYLAANRAKPGVITLPDGLQYVIVKQGSGNNPGPADSVMVHYRMSGIDGKVIDQSYDRGPVGIRLTNVVKGLAEGLQLMTPGSIYDFYIPAELGFGDQPYSNAIPAGSTLVYHVEMMTIHSASPSKQTKAAKPARKP